MCVTHPETCLRVHLSVCKRKKVGRNREQKKKRVRGREGIRRVYGKKRGHQLLAADRGRRLLDGNPAADV